MKHLPTSLLDPVQRHVAVITTEGLSNLGLLNVPLYQVKLEAAHHSHEVAVEYLKSVGIEKYKVVDLRKGIPAFKSVYSDTDEVDYLPHSPNNINVFFLSSVEDIAFAEKQYGRVLEFFPHAMWYQSDKGIWDSHFALAEMSMTDHFLVIDADCTIDTAWDINTDLTADVVVYHVRNPIDNTLVYGHGAPKRFAKHAVLQLQRVEDSIRNPDFTESVRLANGTYSTYSVVEECVGTHSFNWSDLSAYCGALREVAKLRLAWDDARLAQWENIMSMKSTAPFERFVKLGIKHGLALHQDQIRSTINHRERLRQMFFLGA